MAISKTDIPSENPEATDNLVSGQTELKRVNEDDSTIDERLVTEHLHDKHAPKDYRDLADSPDEAE